MNRRGFLQWLGITGAASAAVMLPTVPVFGKNARNEDAVMIPIVLTRAELREAQKRGELPGYITRKLNWRTAWDLADKCSQAGWWDVKHGSLMMK